MQHRRHPAMILLLGALLALIPVGTARAATPSTITNRAGIVVDEGNGTVKRVGITFDGAISGITALQLAGFSPSIRSFGGIGGAVCALDIGGTHYGCPTDSTCLTCAAPDYWSYSRAPAGTHSFTTSPAGAGITRVHNGDIEGWRWGTGDTPAYTPLAQFFPPPATTTTVAAPPPSSPRVTSPRGHAADVPSTTTAPPGDAPTHAEGGSTTTDPTTTTTSKHGTTTTHPVKGTTTTTHATTSDARAGPSGGGTRQLAASPPIVHQPSGKSSPAGWIAFAAIVAAFGIAIVVARRHRARAATE